jgi:non-specific serine/threonine protein kinase
MPVRHQSLWAAIDWSYRLLTPKLQHFFCRLAVFRGGWTVEAAATVCSEPEALASLEELSDCSMVQVDASSDTLRFRMLETLHEFAAEQLSAAERRSVEERHVRWFLTLAERAAPRMTASEQIEWLARLAPEHENFRSALARSIAMQDAETGLRLAVALQPFWLQRGFFTEAREFLTHLLELPLARSRTVLTARALQTAGTMARYQNDLPAARAFHEKGLEISREREDRRGVAEALRCLGTTASREGDDASAERFHKESMAIAWEVGDLVGYGWSLDWLGVMARWRGEEDRALARFSDALNHFQKIRVPAGVAHVLCKLAILEMERGDTARARIRFLAGLTEFVNRQDRVQVAYNLAHFARLARRLGEPLAAARLWGTTEAVLEETGVDLLPGDRPGYEVDVAAARTASSPADFAAAWAAGRRLTLAEALVAARQVGEGSPPTGTPAASPLQPLSPPAIIHDSTL